jgi:uncharacterized membrane protein
MMTNGTQGVAGVGLLVAAYVDERRADDTLERLEQARDAQQFYFDDAAVVRSDAGGKIYINETGDMSTGMGAGVGALLGGIIGVLGGPAGIVVGAGAGGALGAIAAHTDGGFDQDSLKQLGAALPPGSSALVVTTSQDFVEAVREQATKEETLTLAAEISSEISASLSARQDVLMAMVLSEAGVAAAKVVSSPAELAAFGIVVDESGVAARAGVSNAAGTTVVDAVATPEDDAEAPPSGS